MRCVRFVPALALARGLAAPAAAAPAPLAPAPAAGDLQDGLAVAYYIAVFEHVNALAEAVRSAEGRPGAALPRLDYHVGIGKVLTSGENDFVGAHITGLIRLDGAGDYLFEVTSNDGVRLSLGGEVIFEDPGIHADSTSAPIAVTVAEPGWYPLEILYFEKKNTSTLILRWQPPGADGFEVVPAAALKHRKGS